MDVLLWWSVYHFLGVKLSDWARRTGITYHTAYKWFRNGTLPVPAYQTKSGSILVDVPAEQPGETVVYARVSSADQRNGLALQVARVCEWATGEGMSVDRVVTEVGSALNGARRRFLRVLADPKVSTVVCEHRDRVCRFGFEYVEAAMAAHGRRIVVLDDSEIDDDLVRDMTEVLTSLCARAHGRRGARARARAAVQAAGGGGETQTAAA